MYDPTKLNPLADDFIADRKLRISQNRPRLADIAEYQALTGDTAYQSTLLQQCEQAYAGLAAKSPYDVYVGNPEPYAVTLARIAKLNLGAREVLRPSLAALLDELYDGTHGWNATFGKVTLCRVRIQQGLGLPCKPMEDYGKNRGLSWMLDYTHNGWCGWLTGSAWYQIFNDVICEIGWDVRGKMTAEERSNFTAVYKFPFIYQTAGVSRRIAEDAEAWPKRGADGLWAGYPRRWRGTDTISNWMRWHARKNYLSGGGETHFDDLMLPYHEAEPPRPRDILNWDWTPYAVKIGGKLIWLGCQTTLEPAGAHKGPATVEVWK